MATKKRILIVEDDVLTVEGLVTLLQKEYDVSVVLDGETALKQLSDCHNPDLILMDVVMQGLSGYEVCRKIKDRPQTKDIPVIFITGLSSNENEAEGFDAGAADYVTKPIKPLLLKKRIASQIKQHELQLQLAKNKKKLTDALKSAREHEKYVQSILRSAPAGIGLVVDRKLQWINSTMERMIGYSNEEIQGKRARFLYLSQEEFERVGRIKYEQISAHGTGRVETVFQTKSGSVIDIILSSTPLDFNDLSTGVIFTALDISQLKSTQKQLEDKQKTLNQAQSIASIGSWKYDVDRDQLEWSDEIFRIFQIDPAEQAPSLKLFTNIIHPDDREMVLNAYQESVDKKQPYNIVHRVLLPDGSLKHVHERCDTLYDCTGNPMVSIGTVQDVTREKLVEEQLKASEEYLRTLSDASFEAIFLSQNGICIGQNKTAEMMFGYTEEEAVGQPGTNWIVENEREQVRTQMMSDQTEAYETVALRKDGTTFPAEIQARMMEFKGESIRLTALRDITQRKTKENIVQTQLHLSRFAEKNTIKDLLVEFLNHSEKLTASEIGFFHFIDEAQQTISLQAWSTNTLQNFCKVTSFDEHYPLNKAGVWVDCVREKKTIIHNDYASLKHKKGLPEGHAPVTRELVAPISREGRIVAILGVGNKPTAYNTTDIEIIETLADLAWNLVVKKRQEEKIIQAKDEWEKTFDTMTDMVTIHDRQMNVVRANKAAFERLRIEPGQLANQKCCDLFWKTSECCPDCPLKKTFQDGETHSETIELPFSDNSFFVTTTPMPVADGHPEYFIHVARDMTDRKQAEAALRDSEERLRTLINATPDIICFKDAEGRWLEANKSDLELFCLEDVDYRGKTDLELAEYTQELYKNAFQSCRASDEATWKASEPTRCEEEIPTLDGNNKLFDLIKVPLFEVNGERKGLVVLGRDITEQRQLQKDNERSNRLASLGELAAGVAHEINNPNALTLYNSHLLEKIFSDLIPHLKSLEMPEDLTLAGLPLEEALDEINTLLPTIHDSSQRIKHIVNDLRDFARQDSGDRMELVDLTEVVKTSARLVRNTIRKNTDHFVLELTDNLPRVKGIKGRLEQVLINLMINACQALESKDKKITVSSSVSDQLVRIVVHDEGRGIDPQLMDRIFEPFVTTKREQGGTGLGLSVSARIVKEHHGRLEFHSNSEEGTTAQLLLPIAGDQ